MYKRTSHTIHGAAPDLLPQDAPVDVWNECENVFFRNQEPVRAPGDVPILPIDDPTIQLTRACIYVRPDEVGYWVFATNTGIYVHNGTTISDITPTPWVGTGDGVFTMCILGGITYINASDREPVYWSGDPDDVCVVLPDWPTGGRCYALRAHKNFLFAIGFLSEHPARVRWSDAAEAGTVPQFWTPAADNLAGFLDLAPTSSPCWDGETLRDSFIIYKGEGIFSFDFIGGNDVFQSRIMFAEYGLSFTNAITRGIDDVHLFVTSNGDIMLTDGQQVRSILEGRAQRAFYNDFTGNPSRQFSLAVLEREKTAYIFYPANGSTYANRCIMYDFVSGDLGYRDAVDVTCASQGQALYIVGNENAWDEDDQAWSSDNTQWNAEIQSETLDDVITGSGSGFAVVSNAEATTFIDGTPVASNLYKGGLALNGAQERRMIGRVWPKVRGNAGDVITFRFGGQEVTNGPITLTPTYDYVIGQPEPIDLFLQGRFLSISVGSVGGEIWHMGSIDIETKAMGAW